MPVGTAAGDLGEEIQIDPVADEAEKAESGTGNRGDVGRGGEVFLNGTGEMVLVDAVRDEDRVGVPGTFSLLEGH